MSKLFYRQPTFTETTWAILAFTRFVLAFIVLYGHLFSQIIGYEKIPFRLFFELDPKAAVLAFLLISGLSIGFSYAKNKNGFFKRRFLRIYPLYFFAVLFTVFLQFFLGSPYFLPNSTMQAAGNLTSIANFFLMQGIAAITITYDGPLWSIGVEVFLYMMVPLLMLLRLRYILLIVLASMFAFTFFDYDFLYGYVNLIWAWPFIIGLIISARKQPLYTIPLLILSVLIVFYKQEIFKESLSVFTVIFSILICFTGMYLKINLPKIVIKIFNYLGTISYPMYLVHIPLYLILYHIGIRDSYMFVSLVILLCVPINFIFDDWLKKIFWKPLVNRIEPLVKSLVLKKNSTKISNL